MLAEGIKCSSILRSNSARLAYSPEFLAKQAEEEDLLVEAFEC